MGGWHFGVCYIAEKRAPSFTLFMKESISPDLRTNFHSSGEVHVENDIGYCFILIPKHPVVFWFWLSPVFLQKELSIQLTILKKTSTKHSHTKKYCSARGLLIFLLGECDSSFWVHIVVFQFLIWHEDKTFSGLKDIKKSNPILQPMQNNFIYTVITRL